MWWLGYRAVRGQWRMYQKSRNAPGGKWTFTAVLFCVMPLTVLWMLVAPFQHHYELFLILLGANSAMAGLMALPAIGRRASQRRVLERYQPKGDRTSAVALAQRAALVAELDAQQRALAARAALPEGAELDLVTRLFLAPCEACTAQPGVPCAMGIGMPVVMVRKEPVAFCHPERMREAVKLGLASQDDILAQFGNNVPEGIV